MLADATGRPEKFLSLHFANNIWAQNIAEVMGHSGTASEAYEAVAAFAAEMGMIPMRLHKEKAGYILNSMLVPFLMSAQELLADGIADVETIDKTWMLSTGRPYGTVSHSGYCRNHHSLQHHCKLPGRRGSYVAPWQARKDAQGSVP